MGKYKGNKGNLMQHWTLCELLAVAEKHASGLNFIDAHAMAPLATDNERRDGMFARVQNGLPDHPGSAYERAWHELASNGGYPSSAAFVEKIWQGDFSLLLCEVDPTTIEEIELWLERVIKTARCKNDELFSGDWRQRFAEGLPTPSKVGLADGSLTLVSFDPYMYNSRRRFADPKRRNESNLYPDDIELTLDKLSRLNGGILIQLSTYSTNDNNPQGAVISSVNSILVGQSFTLCAVVPANKKMMSMVYARNVPWLSELADLPYRFEKWHKAIPI